MTTGYSVVIVYVSTDKTNKNASNDDVKQYLAAGLGVCFVWEEDENGRACKHGADAGGPDASEAVRQVKANGYPTGSILWMVMEDPQQVSPDQWPPIEAYARAALPIVHDAGYLLGGYGSQALIEHLIQIGVLDHGWQVGGWSTSVSPMCKLFQQSNKPHLSVIPKDVIVDGVKKTINQVDCNLINDPNGWCGQWSTATPDGYPAVSHKEGPVAISVNPKDPSRVDGIELGSDGKLYHWARTDMGPEIIHPDDWPVPDPPNPVAHVAFCVWKPDSSGMWVSVVDITGQSWICLMNASGAFTDWTQRTGRTLKV